MRYTLAVLFTLALAFGVQCSFLPFDGSYTEVAGHGLSYTAVSRPAGVGAALGAWPLAHGGSNTVVVGPSEPVVLGGAGLGVGVGVGAGVDAVGVGYGHGYNVAHGHGYGHDATYVAKTRGAVHKAPLSGHLNSVANVNLLAAPGTH